MEKREAATYSRGRNQVDPRINPPVPPDGLLRSSTASDPTLILVLSGVAALWLLSRFAPTLVSIVFEHSDFSRPAAIGMLFCALGLSVILHELGHLTAALFLCFDVLGGALGPWRISRIDKQWYAHFVGGQWLKASVSAIPKPNSSWRRDMLLVVAAGPLATLWGTVTSVDALINGHPQGLAANFLAFFAELNVIMFVLGMIPNSPRARVHNDARLFLSFLRGGEGAQHVLLYHLLMQMKLQGSRPCFYRKDVIDELARTNASPEMSAAFAQSISDWAFDRKDYLTAEAWDRRAHSLGLQCAPQFACHAIAHSACFELLLKNNVAGTWAKLLDVDIRLLQPEWLQERTRAVQALAGGDILEGMGALQRAEYVMPKGLPCFDFERELLARLRRTAKILSERQAPLPQVR